ncbi:MAG: Mur ligase family protein [Puia sp.]
MFVSAALFYFLLLLKRNKPNLKIIHLGHSIRHIASIVSGSFLQFHQDDPIEQLLTDSRRLIFPESTLFFALYGLRREGHAFIADLYLRGVRNFVVYQSLQVEDYPEANFILVKNSLRALQSLAIFHRQQFDLPVIGITGSNGKTIVKEWLNQLLEDRYRIVRSPRSYNSQIGVPLSIWQIHETNDLALIEAGISQTGEMKVLEESSSPRLVYLQILEKPMTRDSKIHMLKFSRNSNCSFMQQP